MGKQDSFDWESRINIDPEIMGGKPVLKGRRVAVEYVVGALAGGASIEEVCEDFVITEEEVRAALAYAAHTLSEEVVHALPRR